MCKYNNPSYAQEAHLFWQPNGVIRLPARLDYVSFSVSLNNITLEPSQMQCNTSDDKPPQEFCDEMSKPTIQNKWASAGRKMAKMKTHGNQPLSWEGRVARRRALRYALLPSS